VYTARTQTNLAPLYSMSRRFREKTATPRNPLEL
jgi:hypothetical protein